MVRLALSLLTSAWCTTVAGSLDVDSTTSLVCNAGRGGSCGSALLQHSSKASVTKLDSEDLLTLTCDEGSWPDKDHGLVCGECKVLVNRFNSYYKTCDAYCAAVGRECTGAWEEHGDTCRVEYDLRCDQTIGSSDAICQCGQELPNESTCYGEMEVLEDEGNGIGVPEVPTDSAEDCEHACDGHGGCKSFTLCPQWNACFLKDRIVTGNEATRTGSGCKTYFKKPCRSSPDPATTSAPAPQPPPVSGGIVRVASYNIYWWNAFDQNSWKSTHVMDNIKNDIVADTLGLQECDEPNRIQRETGYSVASPFKGAQGLVVKPGTFTLGEQGSRDIEATGKWGPRYVTWAQLTHTPSGQTFWHFNTHWCIHSDDRHHCDANTRFEGAQHMLAVIQERAGDAPVVITGDFNANMNERGPQLFLQNGFSLAITSWVDAIFYSTRHWQVVSTVKGDAAYSDHHPVIADLQLTSVR